MVALPILFQDAGLLVPTLAMILCWVMSSVCSSMLVEAMERIPGNEGLNKRIEFSAIFGHYFSGGAMRNVAHILLLVCLQTSAMAAIIVSAQVADDLVVLLFGSSVGVNVAPPFGFIVSKDTFDAHSSVVSAGFLLVMALCVPLSWWNLEDQKKFQLTSFAALLGTFGFFMVDFFSRDMVLARTPLVGRDLTRVGGVVMFAFAFTFTVPSWANEKRDAVSVNRVVWFSTTLGLVLKMLFGVAGAWAFDGLVHDNVLLRMSRDHPLAGTGVAVNFYNIFTLVPGIPVLLIMVRYNLIASGLLPPKPAFFAGVVLPCAVAMFFYTGRGFSALINWSALLAQGFTNFVLPAVLYLRVLQSEDKRTGDSGTHAVPLWLPLSKRSVAWAICVSTTVIVLVTISWDLWLLVAKKKSVV